MCFYYQCIFNKTDCWCDTRCSCLAKKQRWIKQTRCKKNSSFVVAGFADGINWHPPFFNWWMLWMFKRMSWVITSVQKVAVVLPLVCLPHLWLYTCMYTRAGLYWYRFVHGKAESRVCFASYLQLYHRQRHGWDC